MVNENSFHSERFLLDHGPDIDKVHPKWTFLRQLQLFLKKLTNLAIHIGRFPARILTREYVWAPVWESKYQMHG